MDNKDELPGAHPFPGREPDLPRSGTRAGTSAMACQLALLAPDPRDALGYSGFALVD